MITASMRQLLRAAPAVFAARASLVTLAKAFRMNYARLPICASCQHHMRSLSDNNRSKWHGLWEPTDLKTEPDIPEFDTIHISMKGFDYPVLESYAKYVHKAVDTMFDLESDAWPVPAKSTQIKTFHPNSAAVNDKYDLQKYERTVMVEDVPITTLPVLLEFVRKNCPEGVEVFVKEPDPQEEEERYVPDYEVIELQKEKEAIAAGKLRKK